MNYYVFKLIFTVIFFSSILIAQIVKEKEGLLFQTQIASHTKSDSSGNFNLAIAAIKGWQQISFSSSSLNCQFHPCCSNYAIHSFSQHGFLKGLLNTADRISRCHPFAYKYYSKSNKRLHDELYNHLYFKSDNLPYLSIPVSFVLPGFNKMINGRFYDGLAMLMITEISAFGAYTIYKKNNYFYIPFILIFIPFYASDIYFNFKSL